MELKRAKGIRGNITTEADMEDSSTSPAQPDSSANSMEEVEARDTEEAEAEAVRTIAATALPVRPYLEDAVFPLLIEGLAAVARDRYPLRKIPNKCKA